MVWLKLVVVAAALIVVVATTLFVARQDKQTATDGLAGLEATVLQVGDLQAGYERGDDTGCGAITPEGRPAELSAVLGATFPWFCVSQFERRDGASPPRVESAAVQLETPEIATAVMTQPAALASYFFGLNRPVDKAVPMGFADAGVVIPSEDVNTRASGLIFVWRDGTRVHGIGVVGDGRMDLTAYVMSLAEVQQRRSSGR